MFDKLKRWFAPELYHDPLPPPIEAPMPKVKAPKKELTPKEKATAAGEPYVSILSIDLDPVDLNNGAFDLDWNDKFVVNLVKQGYRIRPDDTDAQLVDRWFSQVCKNVATEVHEQHIADPSNREGDDLRRISTKDIGNGRSEIS